MSFASLAFRPASTVGGAEVLGLSLNANLDKATQRNLRRACIQYSFLLIRNQQITLDEQYRFGLAFGEILDKRPPGHLGSFITSVGELCLHFDHWLVADSPEPNHFTMLYAMKVAPAGGETIFVNMRSLYKRIPEHLKTEIESLHALHCYNYSGANSDPMRVRESDLSPDQPHAVHPIVRLHPETSEPVLYVSPRNTDHIVDVPPGTSKVILEQLFALISNADEVYAHKWQIGDVLVWDNHSVLHGRTPYDPHHERRLRRLCIR